MKSATVKTRNTALFSSAATGCLALWIALCPAHGADWVRAGLNTNLPLWGIKGGLQFGIHPAGFRGVNGGPRGLIRIGYPILSNQQYDLINFIAVEPSVRGKKGFSELELSRSDDLPGKRFWSDSPTAEHSPGPAHHPGNLRSDKGIETLEVTLRIEPFRNGAHVYLVITQTSDAPDEIQLTLHSEPDSQPMDTCVLTATMGNMARTRQLWLRDETVNSLALYRGFKGNGFAPHSSYGLDRLQLTRQGDVVVAITTDEENPASVRPFPNSNLWYYGGIRVTQYWKKPKGELRDDLKAVVNGRYTYWQSQRAVPGGVAFENFELREAFYDGQRFVFGVTTKSPKDLGIEPP